MTKYQKVFLLMLTLLVPVSSYAARNFYGGIQYATITYSQADQSDVKPTAGVVRVGELFNDTFAVEGRFGLGIVWPWGFGGG